MNRLTAFFAILMVPMVLQASEATWRWIHGAESHDKPSLQRGLRLYANYCLGCHSLKFQRYERTADDLEIPHDVMLENVIFSGRAIGSLMESSMPMEAAKAWFGAAPPDLTMVAKVRGPDWIYNYLRTFYVDESRPLGVNNKVFPNVAMPHALELQGVPIETASRCRRCIPMATSCAIRSSPARRSPRRSAACSTSSPGPAR
jgi:cytochrome c1